MDVEYTFDLAFGISERNNPEIIFIIEDQQRPELEERIVRITSHAREDEEKYLDEHVCAFTMHSEDLFSVRFGYGDCGYVVEKDGQVEYRVELATEPMLLFATLTINVLSDALAVPFEDFPPRTNRAQSIVLHTICDRYRPCGYGHAVGGFAHQPLNDWLRAYAIKNEDDDNSRKVSVPEVVRDAMITTWQATCSKSWREYGTEREIRGVINMDGTFILDCFGNACDMGVYPDGSSRGIEMRNLQCHNLDGPVQQVTLLAGFAKLCQLSRELN